MKALNLSTLALILGLMVLAQACGGSNTTVQPVGNELPAPIVEGKVQDNGTESALLTAMSDPSRSNTVDYVKVQNVNTVRQHFTFNTGSASSLSLDYDLQSVCRGRQNPAPIFEIYSQYGTREITSRTRAKLVPNTDYVLNVEVKAGNCDSFALSFALKQ
jgi:hypothetical protein